MRFESINSSRLKQELEEFSQIGRSAGKEGLYRLAFTPEEEAARAWLIKKIKQAGLSLHIDGARNISARLDDGLDGPAVATGSHIDSVPGGGRLDGALGVVCGLECLRRLKECNIPLQRPLELISFTDEEARFGSMFGSKAICGQHTLAELRDMTDDYGYRLEDALHNYNSSCEAVIASTRSTRDFHSFIELHIEQGPILDQEKHSIGIVSEIVGLFRWRAILTGAANHAGTTPMHLRRDALSGFVEFASGIETTIGQYGSEHSRATIGRVETIPGAISVIPGEVRFFMDVRDTDVRHLQQFQHAFETQLREIASKRALDVKIQTIGGLTPVQCNRELTDTIEEITAGLGLSYRRLPSGAAHDALTMASLTNVAMIFVPSIDGNSHSCKEDSNWPDIEKGANVLLNTLSAIGQKP